MARSKPRRTLEMAKEKEKVTIRVLVNGAKGKMGQESAKAIREDAELEWVGEGLKGDNLQVLIQKVHPQVVLDFTSAEVVYQNAVTIIQEGVHPVIGTSGLLRDQIVDLQKRCAQKKLGGIIAPNFSLGAVLMMNCAKQIASFLPHVEIVERHHLGKKDSPSATAIRTAELIAEGRRQTPVISPQKEVLKGARGALYHETPIHSVRLPGLYAEQEITFGGSGETLTLYHTTFDRSSFMPGVCLACKKVVRMNELVYGLEKII